MRRCLFTAQHKNVEQLLHCLHTGIRQVYGEFIKRNWNYCVRMYSKRTRQYTAKPYALRLPPVSRLVFLQRLSCQPFAYPLCKFSTAAAISAPAGSQEKAAALLEIAVTATCASGLHWDTELSYSLPRMHNLQCCEVI